MVPRGGHCKSCKEYTLWGDAIRGCYRRMRSYSPTGHRLLDKVTQEPYSNSTSKPRRSGKSLEVLSSPTIRRLPSKGSRKRKQPANSAFMAEGEHNDLVSSSEIEDNATPMKRKRGRPRKDSAILSSGATIGRLPSKGSRKRKQPANSAFATEGESLDPVASSEIEDNAIPMKRKRGRPRKDLTILSPGASSSVSPPHLAKATRKPKRSASKLKLSSKGKGNRLKPKKSASPAKLKSSSKEKGSRSPAPYQPAKASIRKKSEAVTLTKYRKKKTNKSEPSSLYH